MLNRIFGEDVLSASRRSLPSRPWRAWMVAGIAALVVLYGLSFAASDLQAKKKKIISRTVAGTVLDEADNGISGASVELTDLQTGKGLAIYSDEDGSYQFADLIPTHDYHLQASFHGSSSEVRQVSSMDIRNRIVINLTISGTKQQAK